MPTRPMKNVAYSKSRSKNLRNSWTNKNDSGFTIVEVIIVLCIISLILAIVFWAVPITQRNSRDYKRRTIANEVLAELRQFAAHNSGLYPFSDCDAPVRATSEQQCATLYPHSFGAFFHNYISGHINDTDPLTGKSVFGDEVGIDLADWQDDGEACDQGAPSALKQGDQCTLDEYGTGGGTVPVGKIQIYFNAMCSDHGAVSNGNNTDYIGNYKNGQGIVVLIGLDRPNTYYCISS